MITPCAAALEELQGPFRFPRRPFDDLAEELRRHFSRARASDEEPARRQEPHTPVVDLAVGAERSFETLAPLRESRRIEHHHVEPAALAIEGAELLDSIGRPRLDVP